MLAWIKRHPIATFFLMLFLLPASLNYSGMCLAEGRWLSNDEKIRKVVEVINSPGRVFIEDKNNNTQPYQLIPYKSVDDFLEKNPDCCEVGMSLRGDYFPPTFVDRITGVYGDKLRINYTIHFFNPPQKAQSQQQNFIAIIGNCGDLYED
jgi:hypothetical protein